MKKHKMDFQSCRECKYFEYVPFKAVNTHIDYKNLPKKRSRCALDKCKY